MSQRVERGRLRLGLALGACVVCVVLAAGCHTEEYCCGPDDDPPAAPQGLASVTGDGEVTLSWYPVREHDVAGYRVYWNDEGDGPFEFVAQTRASYYVDRDVVNGRTYFYAVTTVDDSGNESHLSEEIAYDTPRPEGFGLTLRDAGGSYPGQSGYDFSAYQVVAWDSERADIYFMTDGGAPWMVAGQGTDIQDAGYVPLIDVNWAPDGGWSPSGYVLLVEGHSYIVWTASDHYAKFEVVSIGSDHVTVDWAYQIDRGNPELAPRAGRAAPKSDSMTRLGSPARGSRVRAAAG